MNQYKITGFGLFITLAIALFTVLMEPADDDVWTIITGIGIWIFGIWGGILLLRVKK